MKGFESGRMVGKETTYGPFSLSFDEYKKLFRGVTDEKAIGECSNSYLYFQDTAANIKRFIPECKIIIMLRNPIERAYSHHLQFVMLGQEDLTFENALKKEEERKKLNWRWHYQLMGQGLYYSQVKRYIDEFEAKNVSIHLFEELKETPNELMKNIYDFLCVDSEFKPQADKIYNKGGLPKNMFVHKLLRGSNLIKDVTRAFTSKKIRGKLYSVLSEINYEYKNRPVINERTKKHMVDVFKDDALKLQNLINRDLSAWFN